MLPNDRTAGIVFVLPHIIDAIAVILTLVLVNLALISLSGIFSEFLKGTLGRELLDIPRFAYSLHDGHDHGNQTFEIYRQFRWVSYILLAAAAAVAVMLHFLTGHSRFWRDKIILVLVSGILIAGFPFLWDMSALGMESVNSYILNPAYTMNPESPCPEEWSDQDIIDNFNGSPYNHGEHTTHDVDRAMESCRPEWRISYLVDQMATDQEYQGGMRQKLEEINANPLEWIAENFLEHATDLMGGLASIVTFSFVKSVMTIQFGILAVMLAVLADMLTSMIMAAIPLLLLLRLFPLFARISDTLLSALPALFMVPMISALIVTIGSAVVASVGTFPAASGHVGPISMELIHVWVSSMSVLFLAVALPMLLVPMISNMFRMANTILTAGIKTGAVLAANAGRMAVGGAISSRSAGGGPGSVLRGFATGGLAGISGGMGSLAGDRKDAK